MKAIQVFCIDPGVHGGLVVARNGIIVDVRSMPATWAEAGEWLRAFLLPNVSTVCYMEQVNGYIGKEQPGAYMFNFGEGFGFLQGWCAGVGIPCILVTPFSWQQPLQLGLASEHKKSQWKKLLQEEAKARFSEWKPTLATADALLLWDYVQKNKLK